MKRIAILLLALFTLALGAAACGETAPSQPDPQEKQRQEIETHAKHLRPYTPHNDVEFTNFNNAQKLYDSPNTIIWCTAFPSNPSAPIITTPIKGKLTSSSVSYRPQDAPIYYDVAGDGYGKIVAGIGGAKSSDGMYHGSPIGYRYGFTPGGQYVDYTGLETFCTTALTKFQREKTTLSVSNDAQAAEATKAAEAALKRGDNAGAQRALGSLGR